MRDILASRDRNPRLDRGDRRVMLILTLVYTVFTLLNLGTLRFPKTVWQPGEGETVTIDLGEEQSVSALWFNGNIAIGRLLFSADDGGYYEYEQKYGEMFSWHKKNVDFRTRYITMYLISGDIALNEIAFLGPGDVRLPATVRDPAGSQKALLDEQDTVPASASYFNGMYFDEIYHARTAYEFLHGMNVYEWTHPPLGKAIIALGIVLFGMTPFGWRVMPALFGAAMLPLLFILGKRLFRRRDYAFLAAALFALDTMHFAQTRIATVDVFIVFFILLMFLFMTDFLQLDYQKESLKTLWRPLGACGISFGLGVASKWTGLYAGVGLAILFFGHLIAEGIEAHREKTRVRGYWNRTILTLLFCIVFFILLPCLIYFLSYIPFYRYEASRHPEAAYGLKDAFETLIHQQESMYSYHSNLEATHSSQSAWYEWPFTARGVWFYFSSDAGGWVSNITSFGSPAVWWVSAVGTIGLIVEALFGRFREESLQRKSAAVILLIAVAANLLPWTLVPRCTFQYHYFPTLPFSILGAVLLLEHLEERGEVSPRAKWYWLAAAAVYFLLLVPAASGIPMPRLYARFLEYVLPTGVLFNGAV